MANKKALMGRLVSRSDYGEAVKYDGSEIMVSSKETIKKVDFNKIEQVLPSTIVFIKEK